MPGTPLTPAPFTVDRAAGARRGGRHRVVGTPRRRADRARLGGDDPRGEATYLAPVEPSKIIAVHLSYRSRIEEYAARMPAGAVVLHQAAVDAERPPRRAAPARGRALPQLRGRAGRRDRRAHAGRPGTRRSTTSPATRCANDVGLHDFRHADRGAMLRVKGQDGFLPMGPELVPAAEFDPTTSRCGRYVNGEVVQEATAGDLLFRVAYQLADLCRLITLEPGDVVLTGTPANSRPMEPGDVVEVEIAGSAASRTPWSSGTWTSRGPGEQLQVSANTLHVALAIPEDEAERLAADGEGRMIACAASTTSRLRVADLEEAARRWAIQFGLDRARRATGALLAATTSRTASSCVEGEPGSTTRLRAAPHVLARRRPSAPRRAGVAYEERERRALRRRPRGQRGRAPALPRPRRRWTPHARPAGDLARRPSAQARPRQLPHRRDPRAGRRSTRDVLGMRRDRLARRRRRLVPRRRATTT